ncbi:MAG: hypothetical protein EOO38_32765 [Cytophagaceae bacterium]|nr:MAG: hypothetical protein EOO38_32765 [Cytophagaceae bacterium]
MGRLERGCSTLVLTLLACFIALWYMPIIVIKWQIYRVKARCEDSSLIHVIDRQRWNSLLSVDRATRLAEQPKYDLDLREVDRKADDSISGLGLIKYVGWNQGVKTVIVNNLVYRYPSSLWKFGIGIGSPDFDCLRSMPSAARQVITGF